VEGVNFSGEFSMSIKKFFEKVEQRVKEGSVVFRLRGVMAGAGNVNYWIESEHPVSGLSPLWFLAESKLIPDDPPHGLSWEDYYQVVDAELDVDGAILRGDMLKVVGLTEVK
jgi:hypothetical protein